VKLIFVILICYLLGTVPVGYLVARLQGIDIRLRGSGNIGTTNVWRNLGSKAGLIVLAGDLLKGIIAVGLGYYFLQGNARLLAPLAALVGHSWPVFLGFQGGKIIATSLGVYMALDPLLMVLGVILWLVVVGVSRYVSLGSIIAMASLPVLTLALGRPRGFSPWAIFLFALAVAAIAIYKHLPNIRRLLKGKESRVRKLF